MKNKLFLEGNIGVGKSSLVREIILPFLPEVGGFFVQRIFIGDRYAAFKLNEVGKAASYRLNRYVSSLDEADDLFLFSDARGKWQQNLSVFNGRGAACLQKDRVAEKKLILMDELGGIELACPAFMEKVFDVLEGDIPALGVLKSRKNMQKMKSAGLTGTDRVRSGTAVLADRIRSHPQVDLLPVTTDNYPQARARLTAFAKEVWG